MSIAGDLAEERCERAFERERAAFREELDRYRKVAEASLAYLRFGYRATPALLAALAAVGVKVEE